MAISQTRPTATSDSTQAATPTRTGSYSEAYTQPIGLNRVTLADEGSYYTASNATFGTQLTAHAAPAIADTDTKSIIHFYNAGTKRVSLDYITMCATVANASATQVYFAVYLDNKGSTAKTSGGTVITPNNVLYTSTFSTGIVMTAGAVVTAPTTSRKVMAREVRPSIGIALDTYHFSFGNGMYSPSYSQVATVTQVLVCGPPIVVQPGGNFMFVQCGPSGASTAMTFEFEMGYWER